MFILAIYLADGAADCPPCGIRLSAHETWSDVCDDLAAFAVDVLGVTGPDDLRPVDKLRAEDPTADTVPPDLIEAVTRTLGSPWGVRLPTGEYL